MSSTVPAAPHAATNRPAEPGPAPGLDGLRPGAARTFRFVGHGFDEGTATARLAYAFDDGPLFEETFTFHGERVPLDAQRREALGGCLRHLHLAAGVSYYKALLPPAIAIDGSGGVDAGTAAFFERFYVSGLGEFAHRNRIDLRDRVRFPVAAGREARPSGLPLARRTAVPVGGGKDSIVTVEALRSAGEPLVLFALGRTRPIQATIARAGLPAITVTRSLSPLLFELNARGALNGHVPITGILTFVLAVAAVLYDFDAVAMSNERSASVGNLVVDGFEVNHQFSKSLAFERDVAEHLRRRVLPGLTYFSFLRPLSELAIARLFAATARYDDVFTSCNAAFRIRGADPDRRWCRDCPKCRFVFLALAPFMPKDRLLAIFGGNPLDDPGQERGYRELVGLSGHKPFECVGEIEESAAALGRLMDRPEWRHDAVVARLRDDLEPRRVELAAAWDRAMTPSDDHALPPRFNGLLHALAESARA